MDVLFLVIGTVSIVAFVMSLFQSPAQPHISPISIDIPPQRYLALYGWVAAIVMLIIALIVNQHVL